MNVLTNRELCARYLEKTVLPYLQFYCNLDAEHLKHNEGKNFAWIKFDGPKDFDDIKGYTGISITVSEDDNPNIEPHNKALIVIGGIESSDEKMWKLFHWNSLDDVYKGINDLKYGKFLF